MASSGSGKFVHEITRQDFLRLATRDSRELEEQLRAEHAFVVKAYLSPESIARFHLLCRAMRHASPPSWHPCRDGCPDYHRINDEYPKSYVRGRFHGYNFFPWNEHRDVFDTFRDLFALKNHLAGKPAGTYMDNVPSDLVVPILSAKHYPRGGGYLEEHVDPTSDFAKVQTIVQGSTLGRDFHSGGVYFKRTDASEPIPLDPRSSAGDLLLLSPAVRHGVAPVDSEAPLDWEAEEGRWMIIPIFQYSDCVEDESVKPKRVAGDD